MFILRIIPVTWAQITRVWPFADEEKLELSRHGKMPTVMTIIISFVNIYGKHQSCHEYSRYNSKIPHSNKWGSRRKKVLLFAKRKMHFGLVISSFSLLNPSFLYLCINPIPGGGGGIQCPPYGKMSINNFESYFLDSKGNDFLIIGVTDPMKPFLANFFH